MKKDLATEEHLLLMVMKLKADLLAWYGTRRKTHPDENITEVQDLSVKMMGSVTKQKIKTKAAETYGLLLYCVDSARTFQGRLPEGKT
eukprot:12897627-Alexandrium_andersonii.AAC.1